MPRIRLQHTVLPSLFIHLAEHADTELLQCTRHVNATTPRPLKLLGVMGTANSPRAKPGHMQVKAAYCLACWVIPSKPTSTQPQNTAQRSFQSMRGISSHWDSPKLAPRPATLPALLQPQISLQVTEMSVIPSPMGPNTSALQHTRWNQVLEETGNSPA